MSELDRLYKDRLTMVGDLERVAFQIEGAQLDYQRQVELLVSYHTNIIDVIPGITDEQIKALEATLEDKLFNLEWDYGAKLAELQNRQDDIRFRLQEIDDDIKREEDKRRSEEADEAVKAWMRVGADRETAESLVGANLFLFEKAIPKGASERRRVLPSLQDLLNWLSGMNTAYVLGIYHKKGFFYVLIKPSKKRRRRKKK